MLKGSVLFLAALPLVAATHPDFTGTWKYADGPTEIVFQIEHKDPNFRYTASGRRSYMPFSETYAFTTDGKVPADSSKLAVTAFWEGETLVTKYVKQGKEIALFRCRVSPDGRKLTREGTITGRKVREVYDRQ
jgi:hypothetical protein